MKVIDWLVDLGVSDSKALRVLRVVNMQPMAVVVVAMMMLMMMTMATNTGDSSLSSACTRRSPAWALSRPPA